MPENERIAAVEVQLAGFIRQTERSLGDGAETFSQLRQSMVEIAGNVSQNMERLEEKTAAKIDGVNKALTDKLDGIVKEIAPKRIRPLEIFGVVLAVGGIIWAASRYPERTEFLEEQKTRRDMQFELRDTMRDVRDLKEMQRRTP